MFKTFGEQFTLGLVVVRDERGTMTDAVAWAANKYGRSESYVRKCVKIALVTWTMIHEEQETTRFRAASRIHGVVPDHLFGDY